MSCIHAIYIWFHVLFSSICILLVHVPMRQMTTVVCTVALMYIYIYIHTHMYIIMYVYVYTYKTGPSAGSPTALTRGTLWLMPSQPFPQPLCGQPQPYPPSQAPLGAASAPMLPLPRCVRRPNSPSSPSTTNPESQHTSTTQIDGFHHGSTGKLFTVSM